MDLAAVLDFLGAEGLGVITVITFGALTYISGRVYKRFRS